MNEEKLRKASFSSFVTDDDIANCVIGKQLLNVQSLIAITEEGIIICFSDEHTSNAESPIDSIEAGIEVLLNDSHCWK